MKWEWKTLHEMSALELYAVLQHRGNIFAVEQNEAYLDADGKDIEAWHLLGWIENELSTYARILLSTEKEPFIQFGRLSTAKKYRGNGYGYEAVEQIFLRLMESKYSHFPIQISAQTYLISMYQKLDFQVVGEIFNMGRLPHIKMIHPPLDSRNG